LPGRNAISHANRNFVIAYVFLVGLPLLGLAGILKSGRGLSAPFSVDGAWKIESPGNPPASSQPCSNFLSSISNTPFSISQSGKELVITLSGATADGAARATTGTLEGKTVKAQFAGNEIAKADKTGAVECGDRSLTLTATLDPLAEPRVLSGTLAIEGCTSCALDFRAARQPRSAGGTR
jgi:hypothetical protein